MAYFRHIKIRTEAVPERQHFSDFQQGNILKVIVGYVALLIFCIKVEYVVLLLA